MNIYLDIDGVLLANDRQTADFAEVFLQYILTRWPNSTYWLTTHCWQGQNRAYEVLAPKLKKQKTIELIKLIKPTEWEHVKTDALNFSQPFLWFDDDLFPEEREVLNHYHALACYRKIDLYKDPSQLMDELLYLKTLA